MEEFSVRTVSSKGLEYKGRCDKKPMGHLLPHRTESGLEKDMNSLKWYLVPVFRKLSQTPIVIFWSRSYSRQRHLSGNLRWLPSLHYGVIKTHHKFWRWRQKNFLKLYPSFRYLWFLNHHLWFKAHQAIQSQMLEAVWSWGKQWTWAKQWDPVGHQDAQGLSNSRRLCPLPVGRGSTCINASQGSLTHSIDEGCVQDTHWPEKCTGYLKVHQQGSLLETSSCNYVEAHIWLQEELRGSCLGVSFLAQETR